MIAWRLYYVGFLVVLASVIAPKLLAQENAELDSLKNVYKEAIHDSVRVSTLVEIAWEHMFNRPELALENGQRALDLAIESAFETGMGNASNCIAVHYAIKADYPKAISYFNRAKDIWKRTNQPKKLSGTLSNLGNVYRLQGNYLKSLNAYFEVLKLVEQQNSSADAESAALNNIGLVYEEQGQPEKALAYVFRSLELDKKLGNEKGVAVSFHNIGNLYQEKGNLDSALYFFEKSAEIKERLDLQTPLATTYNSLGSIYFRKGQLEKAIDFHYRAKAIQELNNLQANLVISLKNLAETYLAQGKHSLALENAREAVRISVEIGAKFHEYESLHILTQTLEAKGRHQEANSQLKRYIALKDSLLNEEKLKEIGRLESVFELEKMEAENELLKTEQKIQESELERNQLLGLLAGLLLLITVFFSIRFYRKNQKIEKANKLLTQQKDQISQQAHELHQLNEEIVAQSEELIKANKLIKERNKAISDGMESARYIQQAVFPSIKRVQDIIPESFVYFQPKEVISGDFYWVAEKKTADFDGWILAVVDCTGHGIPGAFMSMVGDALLNHVVHDMQVTSPQQILEQMQERIRKTNHEGEFGFLHAMDVAVCSYDRTEKTLSFSGARNGLLMVQDNQLVHWKGSRVSIGEKKKEVASFEQQQIKVQSPVSVYLFSDGYIDQFGGKEGKKFMLKRFKKLVSEVYQQPPQQQLYLLEQNIESWMRASKSPQSQLDDMLVIGLKVS